MSKPLSRAQELFLALVGAEDDLVQAKLMVAAGTAGPANVAEIERRIAYLKAL